MVAAARLGETSDPVALVPGDIHAVRGRVDAWRSKGRELIAVGEALGSLTADGVWSGPAADAFEAKVAEWAPGWDTAANAYLTAAAALDRYAAELDYAQGQAAAAIDLYERGVAETSAARAKADDLARKNRLSTLGSQSGSGSFGSASVLIEPVFFDPGAVTRASAQAMLQAARNQLAAAGDETARVLNGGVDWGRIFQVAFGVQAELALDALRMVGDAALSFGQAFIDHPDLLLEVIGGVLMINAGVAGEAGGVALDATGVGAIGGIPVGIASAGAIAAGAGLVGAGVLQAAAHAAGDSKVEPLKQDQPRGPDGKYTGYDGVSKAKEQNALDELEKQLRKPVERDQVLAHVDGGRATGRRYDGLMRNDDGTYTAFEIKSGTGRYQGTEQETFDSLVSRDNPATARLNGKQSASLR